VSLDQQVLAVIGSLYDAAMDESLWPQVLKDLALLTDSQVASFWVLDTSEQPRLPTFLYINFDPAGIQEYLERMAALDPTVRYLVAHPNQPIVHDGLVITEREKDRHPYYDWHEGYSDTRFRIVGQVSPAPSVQAGVALHRTRKAGRFEPQDIEKFSILHGHLERALTVGFRIGSLGALQQVSTEALDRNSAAILLLDHQKHVIFANRSAERFRSAGDGINFTPHGVTALHTKDDCNLRNLIAQALSTVSLPRFSPGGVIRVSRPSGKRPYLVCVAPVSGRYPVLSILRPSVCILITDPEEARVLPSDRLQSAFGLTEAEAKLAALLASGEELRSAAERLSITYGTARARLAGIFEKTETKRQGQLIKVLLTTIGSF
jgi:DNA-binding CsgD family transcriptional regulator